MHELHADHYSVLMLPLLLRLLGVRLLGCVKLLALFHQSHALLGAIEVPADFVQRYAVPALNRRMQLIEYWIGERPISVVD